MSDDAQLREGQGPVPAVASPGGQPRLLRWLGLAAIAAIFAGVAFALYQILETITWAEVRAAIDATPPAALLATAFFTAASYGALINYDVLALRCIGASRVPLSSAAFASFVGQSFAFTLGFGVLTGGAVRMRVYSGEGLRPSEIVAVSLLCALTFWLGLGSSGGAALLLAPDQLSRLSELPPPLNAVLGAAILLAVLGFLVWSGRGGRKIGFSGACLPLPGAGGWLAAIAVGIVDTCCAAAALYMLLPGGENAFGVSYPAFLSVFALATLLGVVSHVPGGLGVFETTLLVGLPQIPAPALLASLLLFRVIYYVLPFALALTLLAIAEARAGSAVLRRFRGVARFVPWVLPPAAGVAVFAGGTILLVSGALPAEPQRILSLRALVPLPFVETSHMLASVVGLLLLILANGLVRRLANAWRFACLLLAAGAVFSIFKGFDFEEAALCSLLLGMLWLGRSEFYRQSEALGQNLTPEWIFAIAVAVAASLWLGFFAFRHVEYDSDLWWQFAYRKDAPRFLRASLAVAVVALGMVAYALVYRTPLPRRRLRAERPLAAVAGIVARSPRTDARLALLGDKHFVVNPAGSAFIMYARHGRSLVAMGDPVAPDPADIAPLVWRFRELADRQDGTPVFYQITTEHLPVYLDAGFSLVKLGEEAWVDLDAFTLEGSAGRKLRQSRAAAERRGLSFAIVPSEEVGAILGELRDVSDAWLGDKGREKGFSLGYWSEPYIRAHDVAVVRHEERMVAFANIWRGGGNGAEISVDLMRHRPEAPPGTMDLMFIALMDAAKTQGYRWFNLGMAPLSGLPAHRLMPVWARLANFAYRRGDRFYNFEGLRSFKQKFNPVWRPKYLAYVGSFSLPQILFDVTRLIAQGPRPLA